MLCSAAGIGRIWSRLDMGISHCAVGLSALQANSFSVSPIGIRNISHKHDAEAPGFPDNTAGLFCVER